jgi:hypothetical protein
MHRLTNGKHGGASINTNNYITENRSIYNKEFTKLNMTWKTSQYETFLAYNGGVLLAKLTPSGIK